MLQNICRRHFVFFQGLQYIGNVQRLFYSRSLLLAKERQSNEELIEWDKLPVAEKTKDRFSKKRAMFGMNDYKDILGDGTYNLKRNIRGAPWWLKGVKGNELKMLQRKRAAKGSDMGPQEKHDLMKRIKFTFRRLNKNKGKWMYHGDK